jgi:glycerophosphoryl diester phosphodiesterase
MATRMVVRRSELFPGSRIRGCRPDFIAAKLSLAKAHLLRYCSQIGVPVWVWTIDDRRDLRCFLFDPRVETVVTNRPDIGSSILRGRPTSG